MMKVASSVIKKMTKPVEAKITQNPIKVISLEVVKCASEHLALERGFDFSGVVETTAFHGRLDVLFWLIEQGATLSFSAAKLLLIMGRSID